MIFEKFQPATVVQHGKNEIRKRVMTSEEIEQQTKDYLNSGKEIQKIKTGFITQEKVSIATSNRIMCHYTIIDAAKAAGVSVKTAYKDAELGKLKYELMRGTKNVSKENVAAYVDLVKNEQLNKTRGM